MKSPYTESGFNESLLHLPMAERALVQSATELTTQSADILSYEKGYLEWKKAFEDGEAGIWTISLAECISGMEEAIQGSFEQPLQSLYQEAQNFYLNGNELGEKGDINGSVRMYTKALELVPTFWEALDNRGLLYMDLKQWEQAKNDFLQCLMLKEEIQIGLDDPTALVNLGVCGLYLRDQKLVKEVFTEAMNKFPNDEKLQRYLPLASRSHLKNSF